MFRVHNFDANTIVELNFEKNKHIEGPPWRALELLPKLQYINLSRNNIKRFDPVCFVRGAPNLQVLDLSFNEIDTLDDLIELGTLKHLKKLNFSNNPITGRHQRIRLVEYLLFPEKYKAYDPVEILTATYTDVIN